MLLTSQNVVVVLVIEEKKDAPNRIGKENFFLQLVLRYMSLYKYILNVRSFISAFFSFGFSFFFTRRRQQEQPAVVVPSLLYVGAIVSCGSSLSKRQSCLNSFLFYLKKNIPSESDVPLAQLIKCRLSLT